VPAVRRTAAVTAKTLVVVDIAMAGDAGALIEDLGEQKKFRVIRC